MNPDSVSSMANPMVLPVDMVSRPRSSQHTIEPHNRFQIVDFAIGATQAQGLVFRSFYLDTVNRGEITTTQWTGGAGPIPDLNRFDRFGVQFPSFRVDSGGEVSGGVDAQFIG